MEGLLSGAGKDVVRILLLLGPIGIYVPVDPFLFLQIFMYNIYHAFWQIFHEAGIKIGQRTQTRT
jgi:hypothetical protein